MASTWIALGAAAGSTPSARSPRPRRRTRRGRPRPVRLRGRACASSRTPSAGMAEREDELGSPSASTPARPRTSRRGGSTPRRPGSCSRTRPAASTPELARGQRPAAPRRRHQPDPTRTIVAPEHAPKDTPMETAEIRRRWPLLLRGQGPPSCPPPRSSTTTPTCSSSTRAWCRSSPTSSASRAALGPRHLGAEVRAHR